MKPAGGMGGGGGGYAAATAGGRAAARAVAARGRWPARRRKQSVKLSSAQSVKLSELSCSHVSPDASRPAQRTRWHGLPWRSLNLRAAPVPWAGALWLPPRWAGGGKATDARC